MENNIDGLNNGYVSPEEEVKEGISKDIVINDIDEIVVDKNVYDNADIINESEKDNNELYEKLVKIKQDNDENDNKSEEIIVSKIDNTKDTKGDTVVDPEPFQSQENVHLSPEEKLKKEQEERNYDKIIDITDEEEKLKKTNVENVITIEDKKELVSTNKKDDDTDTVDMFYEDLKNMTDKKGLSLDKVDESKYILFDDLE